MHTISNVYQYEDANDGDRLRPLAESLLMRRTH